MKMKYFLAATVLYFQSCMSWAQDIDQSKMDRDLKITEDIVSSLIKNESEDGRFYASNPKATYIPGFGVMIDISTSGRFYSPNFDNSFNFLFDSNPEHFQIDVDELAELEMQAEILERQAEEIERQAEIMARENERMAREHQRALEEKERALEREMERIERKREAAEEKRERLWDRSAEDDDRIEIKRREVNRVVTVSQEEDDEYTYRYSYSKSDDEDGFDDISYKYERRGYQKDFEDLKPMYRNVMVTFLTDYADLIGQLKNDEQVMLVAKGGPQGYGQIHFMSSDEGGKYSGSATRKDIADFKAGRTSRADFENRINFVESKGSERKQADLELFSSILQRLYKADLATTYYTTSPISYERLKSFGVIYNMRMYSSSPVGRGSYRVITQGQSSLDRDERNRTVAEMYPQFINDLKENILDYGKTIQSLDTDESILFQIRLSECGNCDIPKEVNILVKNQILRDLEAGRITENEAKAEIKVNQIQ